ncbi:MAG: hypothetical protein C4321_04665 [Chloroflexota bacterium]
MTITAVAEPPVLGGIVEAAPDARASGEEFTKAFEASLHLDVDGETASPGNAQRTFQGTAEVGELPPTFIALALTNPPPEKTPPPGESNPGPRPASEKGETTDRSSDSQRTLDSLTTPTHTDSAPALPPVALPLMTDPAMGTNAVPPSVPDRTIRNAAIQRSVASSGNHSDATGGVTSSQSASLAKGFAQSLTEVTGESAGAVATTLGPISIAAEADASLSDEQRDEAPGSPIAFDRPVDIKESGKADAPLTPLNASDRAKVVHQVTRHIERLDITSVRRPLEIRMEPAEFGRVTVTIARIAGGILADFNASDPRVAETLERHRTDLAGALIHRGFETARVTVAAPSAGSATPNAFDQTPHRDPSRQPTPFHASGFPNDHSPQLKIPTARVTRLASIGLDLEI